MKLQLLAKAYTLSLPENGLRGSIPSPSQEAIIRRRIGDRRIQSRIVSCLRCYKGAGVREAHRGAA